MEHLVARARSSASSQVALGAGLLLNIGSSRGSLKTDPDRVRPYIGRILQVDAISWKNGFKGGQYRCSDAGLRLFLVGVSV